jgi:glycogen synthase
LISVKGRPENDKLQERYVKILHFIYDHVSNPWVGGGGATRVYEIYKRLAQHGHVITVISGKYPGSVQYTEEGVTFLFLGSDRNYLLSTFAYAWEAARFVRKYGNKYDIVVEDFAPWNPVFSRFLTRRPAVLHVNHKEGLHILRRWPVIGLPFFFIESVYPKLFRYVTALSEETRNKIGIADAQIIPAGIHERLLGNNTCSHENEEGRDGYILYVGRLHIKNKGLDTLLNAMQTLDTKLLLIGRGRDENMLRNMIRNLGLRNVEIVGFVSEERKIQLLEGGSILVLPSRFEGWGIVVLEAAACGMPVIVSDIPELRYAVDSGIGISFKTGDAEDLAMKIQFLLKHDKVRREMGWKAREYARNFSWNNVATLYEKYLIGVFNKK